MNLPFSLHLHSPALLRNWLTRRKVNGRMIDQVTLSIFHRHGLVQEIGVTAKEQHTRVSCC